MEVREHADPSIVVMLVGNKCDLKHLRAILTEDAKKFADDNSLSFIEASALDATNVEEAFQQTISQVHHVQLAKMKKELDQKGTNDAASKNKAQNSNVDLKQESSGRGCVCGIL